MKLYCRQYSEAGEPLLILHGLFGNHGNWAWHARELGRQFRVYALDLRNHGRSPRHDRHTYRDMAEDIRETMTAMDLTRAHILGHSMGGKAAMQLAFLEPKLVDRLVVVDIAPVAYPGDEVAPLAGLKAIDLDSLRSRRQADAVLREYVKEQAVRDFLLTNLLRGEDGGFDWRFNLEALARNYEAIKGKPDPSGVFEGPTLFMKGETSDYLQPGHREAIRKMFPHAGVKIIHGAGHWVHQEKPQAFLRVVRKFLSGPRSNLR